MKDKTSSIQIMKISASTNGALLLVKETNIRYLGCIYNWINKPNLEVFIDFCFDDKGLGRMDRPSFLSNGGCI
jgi:hypothetical protein